MYQAKQEYFERLWNRAYAMVCNKYCASETKKFLQELPNLEIEIREKPMKLLKTIE